MGGSLIVALPFWIIYFLLKSKLIYYEHRQHKKRLNYTMYETESVMVNFQNEFNTNSVIYRQYHKTKTFL